MHERVSSDHLCIAEVSDESRTAIINRNTYGGTLEMACFKSCYSIVSVRKKNSKLLAN